MGGRTEEEKVDLRTFSSGRDENNLAEFPLALLTDTVEEGVKTIEFSDTVFDRETGLTLNRRVCVTGSDKYGLPTAKDEDILLALIQLTKLATNFENPEVPFSKQEVIELLHWPRTGWSYQRVEESLHRWAGVSIHHFSAWRDHEQKTWRDSTAMGVIQYVSLKGGRTPAGEQKAKSVFTWNAGFFKSFRSGYLKRLDFQTYLKLTRPAAKRAYRFLDKRFHHNPEWTFSLLEFACEKVGMSRRYTTGQLKERLRPAFSELEAVGFIEPVSYQKLARKVWNVTITKKAPAHEKLAPPGNDLVHELTARGVSKKTASSLVAKYAADAIRDQMAAFDQCGVKERERRFKNPGGFLVSAIRDGYQWPAKPLSRSPIRNARREKMSARGKAKSLPRLSNTESEVPRWQTWWDALELAEREAAEQRALERASRTHRESYQRLKRLGGPLLDELRNVLLADLFEAEQSATCSAVPTELGE